MKSVKKEKEDGQIFDLVSSEEEDSKKPSIPRIPFNSESQSKFNFIMYKFSEDKKSISRKFYSSLSRSAQRPLKEKNKEYIMFINENRSKQIGFCGFSTFSTEVIFGQLIEDALYSNIKIFFKKFRTMSIIMPETQKNSFLVQILQEFLFECNFEFLQVKFFDENKGFMLYKSLLESKFPKLEQYDIYLFFACLNCLNEVISTSERDLQVGHHFEVDIQNILFRYYNHSEFLKMDWETICELEILQSSTDSKHGSSLIKIFFCFTVSGNRMLRERLIQPIKNLAKINERLDFLSKMLLLFFLF